MEMASIRVAEVEDQLDAAVGKDPFPTDTVDRTVTFERPEALHEGHERRMERVLAVADRFGSHSLSSAVRRVS